MHKRKTPSTTIMPEIQPLLLTIPQAAEMLGIGKDMVYDFIKRGSLPAINLAEPGARPKLRISLAVLQLWITQRERQQNPHHELLMSRQVDDVRSKRLRKATKGLAASGKA